MAEKPVAHMQEEDYLRTRRVIKFDKLAQNIVTEFSVCDERESASTTSAFVGLGRDDEAAAAKESLKQIAIVLTSGISTEGTTCVSLAKTVTDLMALMPKQGT